MDDKHEREVLAKLVDGSISKKDAEKALDMSRSGMANRLLNVSIEVIREMGKTIKIKE